MKSLITSQRISSNNPEPDIGQLCSRSETKRTLRKKNSDSENTHIMEDILCCYQCGLGFKQVGFLSQEERLDAHEKIQHRIKCGECEDFFISHSHLKYHIETQHDARCAD